jgi:hypothetical protein
LVEQGFFTPPEKVFFISNQVTDVNDPDLQTVKTFFNGILVGSAEFNTW